MSEILFQSTRPSRGATPSGDHLRSQDGISIHAPLAGRDGVSSYGWNDDQHFNPRAPRGARQQICTKIMYIFAITDKSENSFPFKRRLSERQTRKYRKNSQGIRYEPPWKSLCASPSHYTIRISSGRYVCLQPKCSILLSYFFPR